MSNVYAPLKNDTFLRALLRQPTDYTPLWLMRQAGRYLPEYRATRAKAGSFMGLATNPDYATEVTIQPLDRYPLDAAILFSDILTVPDAMGLGLSFAEGEGPRFAHPLRDEKAVMALREPDLASLQYVFDAVTQIRRSLDGRVPLIGFSGSPWTLACYMVEGGGSDDFCGGDDDKQLIKDQGGVVVVGVARNPSGDSLGPSRMSGQRRMLGQGQLDAPASPTERTQRRNQGQPPRRL
jgi:uroporphyrinogen decarboxylase